MTQTRLQTRSNLFNLSASGAALQPDGCVKFTHPHDFSLQLSAFFCGYPPPVLGGILEVLTGISPHFLPPDTALDGSPLIGKNCPSGPILQVSPSAIALATAEAFPPFGGVHTAIDRD
jgi:hypothetical protein